MDISSQILPPGKLDSSRQELLSSKVDTEQLSRATALRPSRRLPCLDGLRAVAILMVLVSHAQTSMHLAVPRVIAVIWGAMGGLGVMLFFGLSGFLITYLLVQEHERYGRISLKKFYLRRALRILPAFFFFMLFIVALNTAGIVHVAWPDLQSAFLFYKNYRTGDVNGDAWYVGHIWSLSMEEQFYILWPPLLVFCGLPVARKLALGVALLMPLFRVLSYYTINRHAPYLIGIMFHTTADKMLWGCLLALYSGQPGFERFMSQVMSPITFALAAFFFIAMNPCLEALLGAGYMFACGMTLLSITVAFAIAWTMRNPDSAIARFLNLKWMAMIGVLSYSLYLWQQPFMKHTNPQWFQLFPVNVICTVTGALLSYYLVEKTALRWKARFRV